MARRRAISSNQGAGLQAKELQGSGKGPSSKILKPLLQILVAGAGGGGPSAGPSAGILGNIPTGSSEPGGSVPMDDADDALRGPNKAGFRKLIGSTGNPIDQLPESSGLLNAAQSVGNAVSSRVPGMQAAAGLLARDRAPKPSPKPKPSNSGQSRLVTFASGGR